MIKDAASGAGNVYYFSDNDSLYPLRIRKAKSRKGKIFVLGIRDGRWHALNGDVYEN
jgi:hypothetical protein